MGKPAPTPPPVSNNVKFSIEGPDAVNFEGTTEFTFTVTRTTASGKGSVDYTVTGAGPGADASDFVGGSFPSGTITFAKGETSQTIIISVASDTTVELDESFNVTLSHPKGGTIATATATGIIQDDDGLNVIRDDGNPATYDTLTALMVRRITSCSIRIPPSVRQRRLRTSKSVLTSSFLPTSTKASMI